jgi:thiol-disulfide isomerase/thioredoxin
LRIEALLCSFALECSIVRFSIISTFAILLALAPRALSQKPGSNGQQSKDSAAGISKQDADAEMQLQKAVADAGNDKAALVRNLKNYLIRFPDAPRKAGVYRALVESCQQLQDPACALDYAERLVSVHPDDSEMMLLAIGLLQQESSEASLTRAAGYATRVIDRIEKTPPEEKSARMSPKEWQAQQDRFRTALYSLRGQIEKSQSHYELAAKDFQQSYSLLPNAIAAEYLGEIAEMKSDYPKAIEEYSLAFTLPEDGPAGKVDRREVRMKLGNVWRRVHGSEQGLGEKILTTYDRLGAPPVATGPWTRNKDAKDLFTFVLRNVDGSPLPLSPLKGKVVVLSFWATWCGPCRELEPEFVQIAKNYTGNTNLVFYAVNTDADESLVPAFLAKQKWDVPVVFADGLDDSMKINSLPTVVVLDRAGKISFRMDGFSPQSFTESLTTAIQQALEPEKLNSAK